MNDEFHVLLFGAGAFWFYRAIRTCLALSRVPFLPPLAPTRMRPWITVVLVARDAARDVERSARDILGQREVDLELVIVDDRSDDDTAAVAERIDPGSDRVRVERVREVPDGWLPRTHAFARGTEVTSGEWIVLLDHPLGLADDVLARCVQHARQAQADHLTLIPRGRSGLLEPLLSSALMDSLPAVAATNRDRDALPSMSPITVVRRDALAAAGGFGAFRMTPFGEMAFAQRLREQGSKLRVAQAPDEVSSLRPIRPGFVLETLERVLASLNVGFAVLAVALLVYSAIWVVAIWGAFAENVWGYWAVGGLASQIVPAAMLAQTYRGSYLAALVTPLTLPVELAMTAYAMARMHLRRGVVWQGCYFSIEELRRAVAEKNGD